MLKKGPEEVPASIFVLLFSIGLLILAFACSIVISPEADSGDVAASFFVAVSSYFVYWMILIISGFSRRLVPTIAAIMACGSILTIIQSVFIVVMTPIVSDSLTATVAWLILIWGIPVKGNIIARSIEQHWFAGIAIAMGIFVMQYVAYFSIVNRSVS